MVAPKGNQFWKLRSKHGRDKLFESPDLLWEAACEYFQWCVENPWMKTETKTKGTDKDGNPKIETTQTPTERPFTVQGFCHYVEASVGWWKEFKKAKHEDFLPITTRIDEVIYRQKFEGAAVGSFNPTIIARDLGLADKKELEHSGEVKGITVTTNVVE